MFNVKKLSLIILVSLLVCSQIGNSAYIGDSDTVIRLGKFSITPYSYVIEPYNSTHYQSINETGYVYQSTNASQVFQFTFGNLTDGGSIFIKQGIYYIDSNVTYDDGLTFVLEGEGSRISRYTPTTTSGNTILYFNQSDFVDSQNTAWNTGYTMMVVRHIGFVFDGGSTQASGHGKWIAPVTLPDFDDVSILVKGNYSDNSQILFGRSTGPVGRTAIWRNVIFDAQLTDGSYITVLRLNFDTFVWDSGSILTNLGISTYDTRLIRLESTMGAKVSSISVFRDDTRKVSYFWLTPDDWHIPYIFEQISFYDSAGQYANVTSHFTSSEGMVSVRLVGVVSNSTLKMSNVGLVEQWGTQTNTTATTFVFAHTLAGSPDYVLASFNSTEITAWSWVATSTNITITVVNSGVADQVRTAYIYAKYEYP